MKTVGAIFGKQMADLPKNISVSIIYIAFPIIAFIAGLVSDDIVGQMASFAAMTAAVVPMIGIATTVAEDMEYKSLRFMVMAGVKPVQYLMGIIGFVCLMTLLPMAFYTYLGEFISQGIFIGIAITSALSIIASAILGGVIGIFSKNVQQATAIYTPVMMSVMFLPMLASISETLEWLVAFLFTTQAVIIATDSEANLTHAIIIIGVNITVLLALFVLAYKKKGLKG